MAHEHVECLLAARSEGQEKDSDISANDAINFPCQIINHGSHSSRNARLFCIFEQAKKWPSYVNDLSLAAKHIDYYPIPVHFLFHVSDA